MDSRKRLPSRSHAVRVAFRADRNKAHPTADFRLDIFDIVAGFLRQLRILPHVGNISFPSGQCFENRLRVFKNRIIREIGDDLAVQLVREANPL